MDLEQLTTHQIILLALLVSFVTSIATGIVTVTLMDQAPPGVTNTINRVVERTVEKVVADPKGQTASVITKETTVVVKEEDLITKSIEKGSANLVRIDVPPATAEGSPEFLGLGTTVSSNGLVVTDAGLVSTDGKYYVRYSGKRYQAEVIAQDEEKGVALLKVLPDAKDTEIKFPTGTFADMSALKLGQTIIGISGNSKTVISMGVISGIDTVEIKDQTASGQDKIQTVISSIDSDIDDITSSGAPVLNVFGDMVGMMIISSSGSYIAPASDIVNIIQSIKTTEKKTP